MSVELPIDFHGLPLCYGFLWMHPQTSMDFHYVMDFQNIMDAPTDFHGLPLCYGFLWMHPKTSMDFHYVMDFYGCIRRLLLCYGLPYLHGHPWIYRHGEEVNHLMDVHGAINMTKKKSYHPE